MRKKLILLALTILGSVSYSKGLGISWNIGLGLPSGIYSGINIDYEKPVYTKNKLSLEIVPNIDIDYGYFFFMYFGGSAKLKGQISYNVKDNLYLKAGITTGIRATAVFSIGTKFAKLSDIAIIPSIPINLNLGIDYKNFTSGIEGGSTYILIPNFKGTQNHYFAHKITLSLGYRFR